jgi:dienelactone hydrolase
MRLATVLSGAILLFVMRGADASENVIFRAAVPAPSAFKLRLAQERGEMIAPDTTIELSGDLFRPSGEGPFPAIVWLRDCLARWDDDEERIARHFTPHYVVLIVNGLGPGELQRACTPDNIAIYPLEVAIGALDYLATRAFVRPDRIAVIGTARGGTTALTSVRQGAFEHLSQNRFAAAVAYYPSCLSQILVAPTLILVGERDELAPAKYCREMITDQMAGFRSRLTVYAGAQHGFNQHRLANKSEMLLGQPLHFSAAADQAAFQDIARFLQEHIGR